MDSLSEVDGMNHEDPTRKPRVWKNGRLHLGIPKTQAFRLSVGGKLLKMSVYTGFLIAVEDK